MDIATIAAGLTTQVANVGTYLGPIVLTLVGFGLGYWAVGFIVKEVKTRLKPPAKS